MVAVAPRLAATVLVSTIGILASIEVVAEANWLARRCARVHALKTLRHAALLLVLSASLS